MSKTQRPRDARGLLKSAAASPDSRAYTLGFTTSKMNTPWFWSPTLSCRGPWWKVLAVPHSVQLHRMHSAYPVFVVTLQFFPGQTILLPQHHCYDSGWRMSSGSPRITGEESCVAREPIRSDAKASCRLEGSALQRALAWAPISHQWTGRLEFCPGICREDQRAGWAVALGRGTFESRGNVLLIKHRPT